LALTVHFAQAPTSGIDEHSGLQGRI